MCVTPADKRSGAPGWSDGYVRLVHLLVERYGDLATADRLFDSLNRFAAFIDTENPDGLRVNATATDIWPAHEVTAHDPDGGLTIRYLAGSKQGLLVHFFTGTELDALFAAGFTPVLPLRLQSTRRDPPAPGQWSQWEAIWRKAQSTAWRRRRQVDPAASAATPTSGRYHSHEATGPAPYPT